MIASRDTHSDEGKVDELCHHDSSLYRIGCPAESSNRDQKTGASSGIWFRQYADVFRLSILHADRTQVHGVSLGISC